MIFIKMTSSITNDQSEISSHLPYLGRARVSDVNYRMPLCEMRRFQPLVDKLCHVCVFKLKGGEFEAVKNFIHATKPEMRAYSFSC